MRADVAEAVIDLTAGSMGGIANVLVGQPLDTIKVKMQTFPSLHRNAFTCFKDTFIKDGIFRGLYAGTGPAIAANIAENSVLFCSYGFCQDIVKKLRSKEEAEIIDKAFAGLAAGFLTSFVICPTELIKCKLQAMRESDPTNMKTGMYRLTRDIIRSEGPIGMFRGLSATIAREVPGFFFFFGAYEACKSLITGGHPQDAGLLETICSGAAGGAALWITIFPLDVIKSRIQVLGSTKSIPAIFRVIVKQEGIRGFYKGLSPTLIRTMPSTAALFVTYEYSRKQLSTIISQS